MKKSRNFEHPLLFGFPVDFEAVLSHLQQDMRDDWFFDVLNYKDLLKNEDSLREVIYALLLEGNGQYQGDARTVCDVPKKNYGIRYSLETDFYDRFLYQAICSYLIGFYDPLLSPRVLGHRFNKRREKEKYIFKNRIELWRTFEGITFTSFRNNQALLVTDVINYFENISIELIKDSFEKKLPLLVASGPEKLKIRNAINCLCFLLKKWGYSKEHGLPQNRDASSFIANVVLSDIDKKIIEAGYDYYRYVDDIRIICPNPLAARKALTDLIVALRGVGMNINSAKTGILTSKNSTEEIANFFPAFDDRSIAIDNMWKSRSRRVIARSATYIYQIIKDCIENQETQSRQFRFSVNRLLRLIESKVFDIHSELNDQLCDLLISSLEMHPASTEQYCRLLTHLKLTPANFENISNYLVNTELSIYAWQNYNLWLFLANSKYRSEALVEIAERKIRDNFTSPEVPAIFIYLHCVDKTDVLIDKIEDYESSWSYSHKRLFLLSVKDVATNKLESLIEKLDTKIRGTNKRAKPYLGDGGRPLLEREAINLLDLYNEIDFYEA